MNYKFLKIMFAEKYKKQERQLTCQELEMSSAWGSICHKITQ